MLVQSGCWHCGAVCPYTDETQPPLTQELSDEWFEQHRAECRCPDWPGAEVNT